jgi:hypothetical protein
LDSAKRALAELHAAPPCPAAVMHLWLWWAELARGRRVGGFGPEPFGWSDIEAWARLTGSLPRPSEVRALLDLDREWLAAEAKRRQAKT